MSTKNLLRNETVYLNEGSVNSLIRDLYQKVLQQNGIPEEMKPHWELLKGLLIASKTQTNETTDELLSYILAIGELTRDFKYDRGMAA